MGSTEIDPLFSPIAGAPGSNAKTYQTIARWSKDTLVAKNSLSGHLWIRIDHVLSASMVAYKSAMRIRTQKCKKVPMQCVMRSGNIHQDAEISISLDPKSNSTIRQTRIARSNLHQSNKKKEKHIESNTCEKSG